VSYLFWSTNWLIMGLEVFNNEVRKIFSVGMRSLTLSIRRKFLRGKPWLDTITGSTKVKFSLNRLDLETGLMISFRIEQEKVLKNYLCGLLKPQGLRGIAGTVLIPEWQFTCSKTGAWADFGRFCSFRYLARNLSRDRFYGADWAFQTELTYPRRRWEA